MYQLDKFAEAGDAFDQTILIRESLADRVLENNDVKRKLFNGIMNRGLVDAATGKIDQAVLRQTLAQTRRLMLIEKQPRDKNFNRDYAKGQFNLARLHLTKLNDDRGYELLNDATNRFETLVEESPTDARLWLRYIECLLTKSMFTAQDSGFPPELKKAVQALQPLVMLAPENRTYRLRLTELYQQTVEVLLQLGDVQTAERAWEVMDDKLIRRFQNADLSPDIARVQLISMRQRSLISLGQGNHANARDQLSTALRAWEFAIAQPETESLNTAEWAADWARLEKLRDSIGQE